MNGGRDGFHLDVAEAGGENFRMGISGGTQATENGFEKELVGYFAALFGGERGPDGLRGEGVVDFDAGGGGVLGGKGVGEKWKRGTVVGAVEVQVRKARGVDGDEGVEKVEGDGPDDARGQLVSEAIQGITAVRA